MVCLTADLCIVVKVQNVVLWAVLRHMNMFNKFKKMHDAKASRINLVAAWFWDKYF